MPPVNRKAWNEDLVTALKARHQQAWQQKKQSQYMWRDGADCIQAVRKNISITKTGKIYHLPNPGKKLKKTVYEECRKIITGESPIYPPGYAALNAQEMGQLNESAFVHPYLASMKKRGGAYAIMLAFHFAHRDTMSKDEIIRAAQPHCDDEMEANFHQGRAYGAWKGKDTLVRHDLITEHKAGVRMTGNGWRSNGKSSYSITPSGKKFIQGMLEKWPDAKIPQGAGFYDDDDDAGDFGSPTGVRPRHAAAGTGGRPPAAATGGGTAKPHAKSADDERQLRRWVATAVVGQQLEMKIGKQRRLWLHRTCDGMMQEQPGLTLKHESGGDGRDRCLYITVQAKPGGAGLGTIQSPPRSSKKFGSASPFAAPASAASFATGWDDPSPFGSIGSAFPSSMDKKRRASAMYISATGGHRLGGVVDQSPAVDVSNRNMTASQAAALAAMSRFATARKKTKHDSSTIKKAHPPSSQNSDIVDLVSDDDRKPRARSSSSRKVSGQGKQPQVVCLDGVAEERPTRKAPPVAALNRDDDDDDDFELNESQQSIVFVGTSSGLKTDSVARDDTPVVGSSSLQRQLVNILIDDRERSRNITPRELRIELTKQIKSGALMSVWPKTMPQGNVEERHLVCGDFAFEVSQQSSDRPSRLSVVVERKRIADLIQRSARSDHWKQLQRMRDSHEHAVMLIENDTRLAASFDAYGAQQDPNPNHHLIENETDVFRFIGRAILSSRAIKFIQTRDSRGTFRSIGALALMATLSPKLSRNSPACPPTVASEQQKLRDRLTSGGIHWKIAKEIASEVGSVKAMDSLYNACSFLTCQKALFRPLISNMGEKEDCYGSADKWSEAIYHSYFATTQDRFEKSSSFQELKGLVEDPAVLLSALYTENSSDEALNSALDFVETNSETEPGARKSQLMDICCGKRSSNRRVVSIELPSDFKHCFEKATERSFYTVKDIETDDDSEMAPVITMSTSCGNLSSSKLVIYVIEGKEVLGAVTDALDDSSDFVGAARQAACALNTLCPSSETPDGKEKDRQIILIRGMGPALDAAAKCAGYRDEAKVVCDMVMSSLMIDYDYVVLQAIRLKNELEMIVQQLALACFYYQLLTHDTSTE